MLILLLKKLLTKKTIFWYNTCYSIYLGLTCFPFGCLVEKKTKRFLQNTDCKNVFRNCVELSQLLSISEAKSFSFPVSETESWNRTKACPLHSLGSCKATVQYTNLFLNSQASLKYKLIYFLLCYVSESQVI